MMDDTDFVHLLISFSLQVGLSWALASIIGQLIQPCGYSDDIVGQALLITSVAGTFGSFFLAYLLRSNHEKYFFVYKVLIVLTSTGCLLCFAVNRPNQDVFILLCWMFYGFTAGPLTPVTLELAAEMTYPIPADNSAALLFTVAIGVYFVCTVALTPLLRSSTSMSCSSIITPASASVCAVTALASLIAIPLKPLFKRREMAAKEHANRNMATRL